MTIVREQLLKLSRDLPYLASADAKPASVILAEARAKFDQLADSVAPDQQEIFNRITAAELETGNFALTYLVDGVLVKDQPAGLVGPKKSLKTNISLDLAISLATGGKFLGYFNVPVPRRMAVMSGESGMATLQETAKRICDAAGVRLADTDIIFSDSLPRFGDLFNMQAFGKFLQRDRIEVVIVDPAYLCLPANVNAANLFEVGNVLRNVSEVCRDNGSTLVLAHHSKKSVVNPFAPGQLEDIAWAGFPEFFRQWILINRREQYEPGTGIHRLWLSTGGSAGHGCLVGLDIEEGPFSPGGTSPRVWRVRVLKASEIAKAAADRREVEKDEKAAVTAKSRLNRDMFKLQNRLLRHPEGDTLTGLTDAAGISRDRGRAALDAMADLGHVVACEIVRGNNQRKLQGFKLAQFAKKQNDPDDPESGSLFPGRENDQDDPDRTAPI